ncbi:MAG: hypothetical protein J2P27_19405 [Actinobacteria bacterium]|nr:hypothetical protein [Actinomycetota bacterium]
MRRQLGRLGPFVPLAILITGEAWLAYLEVEGITAARRTVSHGWAQGIAAGVAAMVVLAALLALAFWRSFRAAGRGVAWAATGASVMMASVVASYLATPLPSGHTAQHATTTAIAVAAMAYTATFWVLAAAMAGWAGLRLARGRPGSAGRPRAPVRTGPDSARSPMV